ncbi:EthD family reductase [Aquitalea palustris]|uniref:EthD family reductase n=1 Tax=Aquitalea palustris TaxID=2480983 RepID=A0A454JFD0_9NEIS|nr:EthD family reductase [Aquitalea palustris]RMC94268.1 EthD family reductase [Aquitalea palustris]
MINVSILYPYSATARFDFDYYLQQHMPLASKLLAPALLDMRVEKGISSSEPGSTPNFTALCQLQFESVETFLAAFMPIAEQLQGDIANYTDITPQIQYSEVLLG